MRHLDIACKNYEGSKYFFKDVLKSPSSCRIHPLTQEDGDFRWLMILDVPHLVFAALISFNDSIQCIGWVSIEAYFYMKIQGIFKVFTKKATTLIFSNSILLLFFKESWSFAWLLLLERDVVMEQSNLSSTDTCYELCRTILYLIKEVQQPSFFYIQFFWSQKKYYSSKSYQPTLVHMML